MTDAAETADRGELPLNYEVEQALLSAILVDNALMVELADGLLPEHFAEPVHGRIFAMCAARVAAGKVADHRTLAQIFDSDPALKDVEGGQYLRALSDSSILLLPHVVKSWGETLRHLWIRRQIIQLAEDMAEEGADLSADSSPAALLERAEEALFGLTAVTGEGGPVRLDALLDRTVVDIEHKARHGATGLSTGFDEIDRHTGGLEAPELIVIAGRTGMGKTMLMTNMAVRMGRRHKACLVFSLEMGDMAVARRILAEQTSVPFMDLMRARNYDSEAQARLGAACDDLKAAPVWIDDRSALSIHQMHAAAKRLAREQTLSAIFIDHLGYVAPPDPMANDVKKLGDVMKAAKGMGKDLGVPVVMLCQLSRASLQHDDKRPRLEHLRGSGNIEEDSDSVWFLHRDSYYLERAEPTRAQYNTEGDYQAAADVHCGKLNDCRNQVDVIFAKQRNGPVTSCQLYFDGRYMRMDNKEAEDR